MALRRLFSGWLIAMAALARSVAQALERASEDRSSAAIGAAPDPVMAALAERYPGAPARLAGACGRTDVPSWRRRARTPLSLNSDPAAWPTPRPETVAPPPAITETPVSSDARRPEPAASRRRGPDPGRPERPVVRGLAAARAGAETALPTGVRRGGQALARPARPAASDAAPRRPRAPLTFTNPASPTVPSESVAATPDIPTAETVLHQPAWSEAPPSRLMASEPAKPWLDAQVTEGLSSDPVLARTRLEPFISKPMDQPEADFDRTAATPASRRPRSWFFAKPASARADQALDLSTEPRREGDEGRASTELTIALDPASPPRPSHAYSTSERQAVAPGRIWRTLTPAAARRALSLALAAFRPKPRARAVHAQASERTVVAAPLIDRPSPEPRRPAPSFTRPPAGVRRTFLGAAPSSIGARRRASRRIGSLATLWSGRFAHPRTGRRRPAKPRARTGDLPSRRPVRARRVPPHAASPTRRPTIAGRLCRQPPSRPRSASKPRPALGPAGP